MITDLSEVAAQLRDSGTVWTPTCVVSNVEAWACVVDPIVSFNVAACADVVDSSCLERAVWAGVVDSLCLSSLC